MSERQQGISFYRSEAGYGWSLFLGKRIRWNSTGATSRLWPRISRGGDEDCNRAITIVLWPLGSLDVWWEPHWRPEGSGMCDECLAWVDEASA
jgi:hypothetical protein